MAKRIYNTSVKKWAIKAGIPTGIVGFALLFIYMSTIGVIDVLSYSGDSYCAGTVDDPCLAFIEFTAKEDIFLYPLQYDPWNRLTPFQTDKDIESWKMYRSWGKGWREINLHDTCKGTWCGGKYGTRNNLYSFAFRENKTYKIKIEAFKKNPEDVIKWSFTKYVDPFWYGTGTNPATTSATNITMELGSQVNITANLSGVSTVCVDIDHPDYGDNYTCGSPNANFLFNISYFRKTTLNDSSTQKEITYEGTNQTDVEREAWNGTCEVDCGLAYDEDLGTYAKTADASPYYTHIYENFTIPAWFDVSEGDTSYWYYKSGWEVATKPLIVACDFAGGGSYTSFSSASCQGCTTKIQVPSTCLDNGNTLTMRTRLEKSGGGTSPWAWYYEGYVDFVDSTNQTVYLEGHQYDDVVGLSLNLTGHLHSGNYPTNVKLYINNTLSNDIGLLFDGMVTSNIFSDGSSFANFTYTTAQTFTDYLKIPKTASVSSAFLSLSGFKSADSTITIDDDTEDTSCDIQCSYSNDCTGADYAGCPYVGANGCSLNDMANCVDEDFDTYCWIQGTVTCLANAWHYENFTVPTPVSNIEEATLTLKYDIKGGDSYVAVMDAECNTGSGFSESGSNVFAESTQGSSGITTVTRDVPVDCITNAKTTGTLEFEFRLRNAQGLSTYARFYDAKVIWINNSYPDNVTLEVGVPDGSYEWNHTGEFNSTFSPNRTLNFNTSINSFLDVCTSDSDGYCAVPLYFISATAGIINITDLETNYTNDPNPITLSTSLVSSFLGNSTNFADIPLKFETTQAGIINITDIRYDYAGGNDTINVLVYASNAIKSQFNNSLSSENITFTGNENYTRYLDIHRTANVTNAFMNLSGHLNAAPPSTIDAETSWYFVASGPYGSQDESLAVDENFNTFAYVGDDAGQTGVNYDSLTVYENFTLPIRTFSLNWTYSISHTSTNDFSSSHSVSYWNYTGGVWQTLYSCASDICQKGTFTVTIPSDGINEVLQMRTTVGLNTGGNIAWENRYYEGKMGVNPTTSSDYPNNPYVSVNNTKIWNQTGEFNETFSPNKTSDFSSILNTALNSGACDCNGCLLNGDSCRIPFIFHSDTEGILEYSDIEINYSTKGENDSLSLVNFFSKWNYNFPSFVDFLEFIPNTPTSKNVTPFGQTLTTPIFNITTQNYGGRNMNQFIYLNQTMSCVDLYISQNSNKPSSSLWDGLVGYWPFDIDARDLSDNGNDGAVTGATFNESGGQIGGAYDFDGAGDYIKTGSNPILNLHGNSITLSSWIYPKKLESSYDALIEYGFSGGWYTLYVNNLNRTHMRIASTVQNGAIDLFENNWYHLVGVFDDSSGTITLYVNGIEDNSAGSKTWGAPISDDFVTIGSLDGGSDEFFNGTIDEVRIYNRSLSSSEVSELYDRQKNKYFDQKLTTNWTATTWNKEYLNNTQYWLWADYSCNFNNWTLFNPDIFVRSCASGVDVCSEDFI